MAQLSLLMESMREGLHCEIRHQGVSTTTWWSSQGDAYEINRIRILRTGLRF
jgi:phenylpropionate dioxygenase-like ring-hydroxylating dioxygenase large terminal subunit